MQGSSGSSGIWEQVTRQANTQLIPLFATIELITRCNLRCHHCYNLDRRLGAKTERETCDGFSKETIYRTLRQLKELGSLMLMLTGGEPLLRKDLEDIISAARELGFFVRIKTNGTLLNRQRVASLAAAGVNEVELSFYGWQDATHDGVTGTAGSWQATRQGLRELLGYSGKERLTPKMTFLLHKHNLQELGPALEWAKQYGVACSVSTEITARNHGGDPAPQALRMTREQFEEILAGPHGDLFLTTNPEGKLQCACAKQVIAIGVRGDVYPCIGAPIVCGNIFEQDLQDIWLNAPEFQKIRGLKAEDFKDCVACSLRTSCQRSSGAIFCNTGDYCGSDPQTCMEAEMRQLEILRRSGRGSTTLGLFSPTTPQAVE